MEELKDIHGLTQVSVWPPAIGWWLIMGLAVVASVLVIRYLAALRKYKKSWQYTAYQNLRALEQQLENPVDYKQLLHKLAVEIRRIAMSSAQRETCAGLVGRQWLEWLQINDPHNYDWPNNGQMLIQYQYMPEAETYDQQQLATLITAAKSWVHKC